MKQKETEENWEKKEQNLQKIRGILRGNSNIILFMKNIIEFIPIHVILLIIAT